MNFLGFMKIFKRTLSLLLSFQLAIASVVTYGLPSFAADSVQETRSENALPSAADLAHIQLVQDSLTAANTETFPTQKSDFAHLTNQTLTLLHRGEEVVFNLTEPDLAIPSVTVADFERDVTIDTTDNGSLRLSYKKRGKTVATQIIHDVKPVSMSRDKEILMLVDQRGRLMAMDVGYARLKAFSTPIPVIEVGQSGLSAQELSLVKSSFLNRGVQPMPRSQNSNHIFPVDNGNSAQEVMSAGDFALYIQDADGVRTQVGEFDRDVIRTQLYNGEAVLAMSVFALSPPDDAAKVVGAVASIMNDENAQVNAAHLTGLSDAELEVHRSLSLKTLLARAQANQTPHARDQFSRGEWADYAAVSVERAKSAEGKKQSDRDFRSAAEKGELGDFWQEDAKRQQAKSALEMADQRPLWYHILTSKKVRLLAAVTAGAGASAGVAAQTAWGVHLMNLMYQDYWPGVLKDSVYRVTLLKSSLTLAAFLPLTYVVGMIASTKTGFAPIKSLAFHTTKIYAELILPFWHRMSGLVRQPNLLRALAVGVSPFENVRADSQLGRHLGLEKDVRPALSNPFLSKSELRASEATGVKVLNALVKQKNHIRSLAWLMALETASTESGIDPATLATLTGSNAYDHKKLETLVNDPVFLKQRVQLAAELEIEFAKISRGDEVEAFSQIDVKDLNMYFQVARARAHEIKARSRAGAVFAALKARWISARSSIAKGFATFGKDEYNFLKEAAPSDAVVSLFWKQYVIDYSLAVGQIGLFGARANMNDSSALAANAHSFLWTTAGHRFDMIDQVRIYLLSVPAGFMMSFQDPSQVRETNYDPIETISMQGRAETEGIREGAKTWLREAFDPQRADEYGQRAIRSFVRGFRTMQFNILMSMSARVLAAGQPFGAALGSYLLFWAGGKWGYAWPWDPVNMGNLRYDAKFEQRRSALIAARGQIAKGLRLNSAELLNDGYKTLTRLYIDNDTKLPDVDKLELALTSLTTQDLKNIRGETAPYLNAVTELHRAIQNGSAKRLAAARGQLENIYRAHGLENDVAAVAQLNSINLLEYSIQNPPFKTRGNATVPWISTMAAALSTTYLATIMSVYTFRANVDWVHDLTLIGGASAGLYAAYFYGTKWIAKKARGRAETAKTSGPSSANKQPDARTVIRSCPALFAPAS